VKKTSITTLIMLLGLGAFAGGAGALKAQESQAVDGLCAFNSDHLAEKLYVFPADKQASALFEDLLGMSGKKGKLSIKAANVPEIAAAEKGEQRFLFYDPFVINEFLKGRRKDWRVAAVIGHQIGHQASSHSFALEPRLRAEIELEADRFAGYLMFRLGAKLEDVETAVAGLPLKGDASYPDPPARVAAFREGWHDGKAEAGGGMGFDETTENIPQFPMWPPPRASGNMEIPSSLLIKGVSRPRLRDAAERILKALDSAGYGERSFYSVPDGFALVARIEQIYPDGRPKEGDARWPVSVEPPRVFDLRSYFRALFNSTPGFYRVIAFVVTSRPLIQSSDPTKSKAPRDWVWGGSNRLPTVIGFADYTANVSCTALIYEFQQASRGTDAVLDNPGLLTGRIHMERSALLAELEK